MFSVYDVAIIGGGVTGAATAFELAHYDLKCVLLEAQADCSFGVSKANSGIVHGGFHYSAAKTLKGRLELKGNRLIHELAEKLDFSFNSCGIIVAAFTPEQMEHVAGLYACGLENGVRDMELCSAARLMELEPKLKNNVVGGLYVPHAGVIEPYTFVFALIDCAKLNHVEIKTHFKVNNIQKEDDFFILKSTSNDTVRARYVINAAGLFADEISRLAGAEDFKISPRKGEEYLLDRLSAARPSKVIFPVPSAHSKGVLVIPTAGGTTMIGPTANVIEDKNDTSTTAHDREEIFSLVHRMVSGVSEKDLITSISGSRPVITGKEDFFITASSKVRNFIQAAGIQSPGLTAAPAVAKYIVEILSHNGLFLQKKSDFIYPEKIPSLRNLTPEQAEKLYQQNPQWANIICRCEKISEAEIRIAVRKGHTTLDGVKLATRATMGRCQGGFCTLKILRIIADETKTSVAQVMKNSEKSAIVAGDAGEF